jgi:hypothetical protein
LVAQVVDRATTAVDQLDPAGFAEAVHVVPAAGEGWTGGDDPAV